MGFFSRPCFFIIGNSKLFSHYRSSFTQLAKNLFQQSKSHMAYLDTSSKSQIEFNKILSSYYDNTNDEKLFVSTDDNKPDVNNDVFFPIDSCCSSMV